MLQQTGLVGEHVSSENEKRKKMQVLNFEPGDGGGVGQGDLLEGAGYHCHRSGHKCYSRYLDQVQYFFKT